MASVLVEFDSGAGYQKSNVKITPAMSIQSITQNSCQQMGLHPSEAYALCLKKQVLQPSLSVRLAGLSNGSKLNLIYKGISLVQEQVTIALQTEESGRLIDKFDPSITLWELLTHFETKSAINLTTKTAIPAKRNLFQLTTTPLYVMPVCVFMNKEFSTIESLRTTSLSDLGLQSGTAAIRLLGRITDQPLSSFLAEIEKPLLKRADVAVQYPPPTTTRVPAGPSTSTTHIDQQQLPDEKQSHTVVETAMATHITHSSSLSSTGPLLTRIANNAEESEVETVVGINPDLKIYKPVPEGTGYSAIELPPSFFSLSSAELKIMIESQKSRVNALENRPLMTQAMREREEKLKRQKYPKTMVRVRFSDRYTLESTFYSGALVSELYKLISERLASPAPIQLYISPPVTILDPTKTFWHQKLAPASLVHVKYEDASKSDRPTLKDSLILSAIDYPVPEQNETIETLASEDLGQDEGTSETQGRIVNVANPHMTPSFQQSSAAYPTKKQTPKWFRL